MPTTRPRLIALLLVVAGLLAASVGAAVAGGSGDKAAQPKKDRPHKSKRLPAPFTDVVAFATKTGFRGVVSWSTSEPIAPVVRWGASAQALDQELVVPDAPDTAGVAVIDGLEIGATYYVSIEDRLSGVATPPRSLVARNAYNNLDEATGTYTLNLLVQLDSQSLPPEVPADQALEEIAAGQNVFAERVYDALDGRARLGQVLVTDTQIAYAVNEPFGVEETVVATSDVNPCGADRNLADVLIQTTIPFDSHTFGWAIDEPCTSFYVGRLGQLVTPWADDLHFGYVSTHEMLHYAFGAPDLYDPAETGASGCRNLAWDGSLMHNTGGWKGSRWELTELDRDPESTPCDHQHDPGYTWDELQSRYTAIPDGPIEHVVDTLPRGNADGGALDIRILDRTPASSTLRSFTPDDANPEIAGRVCAADGRSTSFTDPSGDATMLLGTDTGVGPLNDPAVDVVAGAAAYADVDGNGTPSPADRLTFTVEADDLQDTPAAGGQGEFLEMAFSAGSSSFYASAQWDRLTGEPTYELGRFETTRAAVAPVTGTWDIDSDRVTIVIPAVIPAATAGEPAAFAVEPGVTLSGFAVTSRRVVGVVVPDADTASGGCDLTAPGTPPPPPPTPPTNEPGSLPTEPSATLRGGDTVAIEGTAPATNDAYADCVDVLTDPRCVVYLVDLQPGSQGALAIDIEADDPLADFDVYVYDLAGTQVGFAGLTGPVDVGAAVPVTPGRYYVQVVPYTATKGSPYALGLTLLSD